MIKNKSLVIATIILGILVVVMGIYIVCNAPAKNDDTKQPNTNENIEYIYDNIKGLYTFTSDPIDYGNENVLTTFFYLYLYENGTFTYRMGRAAPFGYMGNYIITDNTIVLNYLFSTNSGAGINVTTGSKIITITDKDTLVDVDPIITIPDTKSVTLKKASDEEASRFLQYEDFSYILNNYLIVNNTTEY